MNCKHKFFIYDSKNNCQCSLCYEITDKEEDIKSAINSKEEKEFPFGRSFIFKELPESCCKCGTSEDLFVEQWREDKGITYKGYDCMLCRTTMLKEINKDAMKEEILKAFEVVDKIISSPRDTNNQ